MNKLIAYDSSDQPLHALYQWDINQVITFKDVKLVLGASSNPCFHLSNMKGKTAFVVQPISGYTVDGNNEADLDIWLPHELLQAAEPIDVYLYERNSVSYGAYRTTAHTKINVIPRPKPSVYGDDIYLGACTFTCPASTEADVSLPQQGGNNPLYLHQITSHVNEYMRMSASATSGATKLYLRVDGDSTLYPLESVPNYTGVFAYNYIPGDENYTKTYADQPTFAAHETQNNSFLFGTTYTSQKACIIYEAEV